jgi:hypothetical protein
MLERQETSVRLALIAIALSFVKVRALVSPIQTGPSLALHFSRNNTRRTSKPNYSLFGSVAMSMHCG